MPKNIILDTNFLFIPARYKVDIFSEINNVCDFDYVVCVLDKSFEEIKKIIINSKGRTKREAELALNMVNKKNPKVLKTGVDFQGKSVDDIILSMADKNFIVATQDRDLKKKLLKKGVWVIVLRQKNYLKIVKA